MTPLHVRVAQLVRLLASDKPGEVAAAAAALNRALNGCGRDLNWAADVLAAALESPETTDDGNEWIEVDSFTLSYHQKAGSRPTLRIEYCCGARTFSDWLPLQHHGAAREIAVKKWRRLGGAMPAPTSVTEAIGRIDELCDDVEIVVRREGQFWVVADQRMCRMGAAA